MGADALRYFLLREVVFGQDGSFSYDALIGRYNSELANGLGDLVSRTLTMIGQYRGGAIPAGTVEPIADAARRPSWTRSPPSMRSNSRAAWRPSGGCSPSWINSSSSARPGKWRGSPRRRPISTPPYTPPPKRCASPPCCSRRCCRNLRRKSGRSSAWRVAGIGAPRYACLGPIAVRPEDR